MLTALEIEVAEQLISQGLAYWNAFQASKDAGTLTSADLDTAAAKLDQDVALMVQARQMQKDAQGTQATLVDTTTKKTAAGLVIGSGTGGATPPSQAADAPGTGKDVNASNLRS